MHFSREFLNLWKKLFHNIYSRLEFYYIFIFLQNFRNVNKVSDVSKLKFLLKTYRLLSWKYCAIKNIRFPGIY